MEQAAGALYTYRIACLLTYQISWIRIFQMLFVSDPRTEIYEYFPDPG
jgi:hypothetical protein